MFEGGQSTIDLSGYSYNVFFFSFQLCVTGPFQKQTPTLQSPGPLHVEKSRYRLFVLTVPAPESGFYCYIIGC